MIEVPYWWDRKVESLKATIYEQRPDLITTKPQGVPIPKEEPVVTKQEKSDSKYFKYNTYVNC